VKPPVASSHLFAYGTLVDPARLNEVLGHTHRGERLAARLRGYRRVMSTSFDYPFLVAEAGSFVEGVLIMDLSADDLRVLDRYEEVESGVYQREPVQVEAWGCGPNPMRLAADVYVAGTALLASTDR
jgi:gamma-glutamylcyclotransferase (GGCT)/AIG2-like uncharacterized protein YtfP